MRTSWRGQHRAATFALVGLAVAFAVTHVLAGYTESINWDEFALVQRAERTIATGQVHGGGRPGLTTLVLVPFVHDCTSSIDTMHVARLAWSLVTFGLLGGLFAFLVRANRGLPHAWHAAALGTALLALVPTFVKWSLHVRSDQPALTAALWGGVALFASARRTPWAIAAGALFALGYLFSEKAIYGAALVVPVVAGELFVEGRIVWRRELLRVAGTFVGGVAVLGAYRGVVPLLYDAPSAVSVGGGLSLFDFYRAALGYRVYREMLPTLLPHIAALALLAVAIVHVRRRQDATLRRLIVAFGVAAIGFAVGKFHAAAFPYFWITLGAFFALSIGLAWPSLGAVFPRVNRVFTVVIWGWLVVGATRMTISTLEDSQEVQRDTLGFVEANFAPAYRSYDTHGALFCRADPDPIPAMMVSSLIARFSGPHAKTAAADFIREHRARPIAIVLVPNRTGNYPNEVLAFWDQYYQPYYGAVRVAGTRVKGSAGTRHAFDVIVPGRYRWWARDGKGSITIGGRAVAPVVELATGAHTADVISDADGMLVLDVPVAPSLFTAPFYSGRQDQRWHEQRDREKPPPVFR